MNRAQLFLIISFALLSTKCNTGAAPKPVENKIPDSSIQIKTTIFTDPNWIFERIDKSKLVFKNGKTIDTKLFELKYIGQVYLENKAPFLIFSGIQCDECDMNTSIYVHDAAITKIEMDASDKKGEPRFQYPGKQKDINDTSLLLYEGRAFYGQILNNIKGVVWYEKRLSKNKEFEKSVLLLDLTNGKKEAQLIDDKGQIKETLALMNQGLCKEIQGKDYYSEP